MAREPQELSAVYRIDVAPSASGSPSAKSSKPADSETMLLLRALVDGQKRQNDLLEDLVEQLGAAQRQRAVELGQWREANPILARRCRAAAEVLSQVQTEFLENLTMEVKDNFESLLDGEFMLNEFVDRYGPRLAHLNGVLQVLSQLSSAGHPAGNEV
jgi:hypothetical protein